MALSDPDVAVAAVQEASAIILAGYEGTLTQYDKGDGDFATNIDIESEEAIKSIIARERPDDGFVGEESGAIGQSNRTWLVDPLCGTLNFAAGTPLFSVNVALRVGDRVEVAAVAEPSTDRIYWTDGQQAYVRNGHDDRPLQPDPSTSLVDLDLYYKADFTPTVATKLIADPRFMGRFGPRVTSSTLATTWVASGQRAAYFTDGSVYDSVHFAAGVAICRAAGCVVTDVAGNGLEPDSTGLLVSADEEIHGSLLELIGTHLA